MELVVADSRSSAGQGAGRTQASDPQSPRRTASLWWHLQIGVPIADGLVNRLLSGWSARRRPVVAAFESPARLPARSLPFGSLPKVAVAFEAMFNEDGADFLFEEIGRVRRLCTASDGRTNGDADGRDKENAESRHTSHHTNGLVGWVEALRNPPSPSQPIGR